MKKILLLLPLLLVGCGSLRKSVVVTHATHDTLYVNTLEYDSVYVRNDLIQEYRPSLNPQPTSLNTQIRVDTVYQERICYEYKYKLLRDTLRDVRVDSIPVVHEVEVVKTVKAVPTIYKWALGISIVLIVIILAIVVIRIINAFRVL